MDQSSPPPQHLPKLTLPKLRQSKVHQAASLSANVIKSAGNPLHSEALPSDPVARHSEALHSEALHSDPVASHSECLHSDPVASHSECLHSDPVASHSECLHSDPVASHSEALHSDPVASHSEALHSDPVEIPIHQDSGNVNKVVDNKSILDHFFFPKDQDQLSIQESSFAPDPLEIPDFDLNNYIGSNVSFRTKLNLLLLSSRLGKSFDFLQVAFSVFSTLLYVISTYTEEEPHFFFYIDIFFSSFFLIDLVLKFYLAEKKLKFLFSFYAIVDITTIGPVFLRLFISFGDIQLNFIRVVRVLRILRTYRLFFYTISPIQRQVFVLAFSILSLIFVGTGLVHVCESKNETNLRHIVTFHDALYFVLVTITTVGYGDFFPLTQVGRVVVMLFLIATAIIVPIQTRQLGQIMSLQTKYDGKFENGNKDTNHILVSGNFASNVLTSTFNEFFHEDRGINHVKMVVLSNKATTEVKGIIRKSIFDNRLTFLKGSLMDDRDLKRGDLNHAMACFIMSNQFASDSNNEDKETIMRFLSVKKYNPRNPIRTFVQIIKPENKNYLLDAGVDFLVCFQEIKLTLLARNVQCPGLSTLLCNLVKTENIKCPSNPDSWVKEYIYGSGHEIYQLVIPPYFHGKTFAEAASSIFKEFNAVLFAIDIPTENSINFHDHTYSKQNLILNPGTSYRFVGHEVAFCITQDEHVVKRISNYEVGESHKQMSKNGGQKKQRKNSSFLKKKNAVELSKTKKILTASKGRPRSDSSLIPWRKRKNHFHILTEPRSKEDLIIHHIPEDTKNHLIICGNHGIVFLIRQLRNRYEDSFAPIVVIFNEKESEISIHLIEDLLLFPQVYIILGQPTKYTTLSRGGIERASKILLLAPHENDVDTSNEHMIDADTLLIYICIEGNMKSPVNILMELLNENNVRFFGNNPLGKSNNIIGRSVGFLHPMYMEGNIYLSSMLNSLLVQAFFNPYIINLLMGLLAGYNCENSSDLIEHQSFVILLPLPAQFIGKPYINLFQYYIRVYEYIPLGLYRAPQINPNSEENTDDTPLLSRFVFTCPPQETILQKPDLVYVLTKQEHRNY